MLFDDGVLKNLSDLTDVSVPQSRISYARTNASGEIDLIALSSTTGEKYGRAQIYSKPEQEDDLNGGTTEVQVTYLTVTSATGDVVKDVRCAYSVRSGDFVAVKLRDDGRLQTLSVLDKLGEVSASAWIGTTAVNYGGRTYTVPSDVLCWNRDGGSWLDGGAEAALAYGGTMNLYVRDGVVRVIEVRS